MGGLRGHLHMATGADFMFERDDRSVALAGKEALEPSQHIFINLAGQLCSLGR